MASEILVVDDEEDIRELVAGILSDEGHETRTAKDADTALQAIDARMPRLVFLDIWLQGRPRTVVARRNQEAVSGSSGRDDFRTRQH